MEPALNILQNTQPHEKVLLHSFSSGGATATYLLAATYRARTSKPLPVSKTIFDSSPGIPTYGSTVRAFSVALPRTMILRAIGAAILRLLFGLWFLVETLARRENLISIVRRALNDETLFATHVPRLYVYGGKDELIRWQDVDAHAEEAKMKGYKVTTVRYADSVHVGHLMHDEQRYWGAVKRLWDIEFVSGPGSGSLLVAW